MTAVTCWLKQLGAPGECHGPLQRAHLIPKQVIRREVWEPAQRAKERGLVPSVEVPRRRVDLLWDPRVWQMVCELHHVRLDRRLWHLRAEDLPDEVVEFAREYGLLWWLERDYGLVVAA